MTEGYTQVAVDGLGDKIRTNELTILQEDGTRVVVSMQIIGVADAEGNIIGIKGSPIHIDSVKIVGLLEEILNELRLLRLK